MKKRYVEQKQSHSTHIKRTRGIIPQSTLLRVLIHVVLDVIGPYVDCYSKKHGTANRALGAKGGGQILDITTVCQQSLALGRNLLDQAAVGQMDIRTCHDHMDRVEMTNSLKRRGVPMPWCVAALRTQRCPKIQIKLRNSETGVVQRQRGALTGNSFAPVMGCLLVEDGFFAVRLRYAKVLVSTYRLFRCAASWVGQHRCGRAQRSRRHQNA